MLLSRAGSVPGRQHVEALRPLTESGAVREALATTTEGRRLVAAAGRQPYQDLPDVGPVLEKARVAGFSLEPAALMDTASFADGALEIASSILAASDVPRLQRLAARVADCMPLSRAIRRAILPSGEVADDASPRLAEIRRSLVRLKSQLHSVMESLLRGKDADRVLQDKLITTRNDRYVLLLKADQRGQLQGIIHGSSGSGATLFVEPLPAVELNNDIVSLSDDERREVLRILTELTALVGDHADRLDAASAVLGELDAIQARALAARDMDAQPPQIVDTLDLELLDARHPLLIPALCERLGVPRRSTPDPVPVTIRVGSDAPALVISGPNTGGKTVALKTVGLLALMAQCGLHVPAAAESRLPVFRRVFADIGDDQSIAANLSTFSAHLAAIAEMSRDLALPALVLLDEVGAGTDPTEGGALGVAIVDHFRRAGAMVVATTHHGLMKSYAQSTTGVACASFGYDPVSFEPTYRLALGQPGRSLALEMAERLGLGASIVADARARVGAKEVQLEASLKRLEDEKAALEVEARRLEAEREALAAANLELAAAERELGKRKRTEVEALARELRRRTEELQRQAADAIQKAVARVESTRRSATAAAATARSEAISAIRQAQQQALDPESLGLPPEPELPAVALALGTRVRLKALGLVGEVLALHGDEVEVAISGKRLRAPRSELLAVGAAPRPMQPSPPVPAQTKRAGDVPAEINLVGLTVDEALPQVDKLLDDAALAERRQVRVIHGFGQGRLRRAVAELLDGHPHVAAFHAGAANEGGAGVTVVELKD